VMARPCCLLAGIDWPLEAPVVMARPCCLLAGVDQPLEGLVVMARPLRLLPVVVRPSYQPTFVASCCYHPCVDPLLQILMCIAVC
jgi:hypothetical protein